MKTSPGAASSARGTRGFWPMRDLPMVGWLLTAVLVALAHPLVPAPRWLLIHLVLLGAATHSILVWSRYFSDALLHSRPGAADRAGQNRRLVLMNLGVVLVLVGVSTAYWRITVVGGGVVAAAVVWHAGVLVDQLRATVAARFATTVHYYLAAAALLPVGATLGVILARGQGEPWHQRLLVAHASVNLLGWIGLTALGTLVTLWPTMLRTRIAVGAERAAYRALPVLLLGIALAVGGPLCSSRPVTAIGYLTYLVALGVLAAPFVAAARARPPRSFATCSVAAAMAWLAVCLIGLVVVVLLAPSWHAIGTGLSWWAPFLAAGFAIQLLLGASSYLVPVVLGGGPGPVRTANAVLDRGWAARVMSLNLALVGCLLPIPGLARQLLSGVVLVSLAWFLPLLVLALRASRIERSGQRGQRPVR